jgi:hypothetical protein
VSEDAVLPADLPNDPWLAAREALLWAADRLDREDQEADVLAPGESGFDALRLRAWAQDLAEEGTHERRPQGTGSPDGGAMG